MSSRNRPGDELNMDNPEIRPGDERALHDVNDQPADERALHDVNDQPADERSIEDPNIRRGVDNPNALPPAGGIGLGIPKLAAFGAVVVAVVVAAIVILNSGGGGPGGGAAAPKTATLVVTGGVEGSWTLDGISGDVSPDASLIATTWSETIEDVAAGYADFITVTVSGDIAAGTRPTSSDGVILVMQIWRLGADGTDVFDHLFTSRGGECQVTMNRGASGISGTFECASITDGDGHAVKATGSFAT